jgi:tRNA (guanine-N7-)-methyltransferase
VSLLASNSSDNKHRPVRSYVIRSGRLTESQRKAIASYWDNYVVEFLPQPLDLNSLFPQIAPVSLEIGFGMGSSLLTMAQQAPEKNFLGIEVHRPGIGKVLHEIESLGIKNLKLICQDAKEVIDENILDSTIERILILFPDPWPKKRHNKRRLVQPEFIEKLSNKLQPEGLLHLATDWQPYAEHMMEVLEDNASLQNQNGAGNYSHSPERPRTKFEARGERLGHGVWDLLYSKSVA